MQHAVCVVGVNFGDEGKGTITDFLTRQNRSPLTVRFNGGAQASHHVVLPAGTWHAFHQWGSGTFAGARTHLTQDVVLDPFALAREARDLTACGLDDPWPLLTIDPRTKVVTPYQQAMNRLRELARGADRHGSCGLGIGEVMADEEAGRPVLIAGSLEVPPRAADILDAIRLCKLAEAAPLRATLGDEARELFTLLDDSTSPTRYAQYYGQIRQRFALRATEPLLEATSGTVVFEGAQGVLLDQYYGFRPHYTWSETTPANVVRICRTLGFDLGRLHTVGVSRTYTTRHGAGPFPTEGRMPPVPEPHNTRNDWQGGWRTGALDVTLLDYALRACTRLTPQITLALTHLDWVQPKHPISLRYAHDSGHLAADVPMAVPVYKTVKSAIELTRTLQQATGVPITLWSNGPTHRHKVKRQHGFLRAENP